MKLRDYINEETDFDMLRKLVRNIKKDCKPFLKEVQSCKRPLYRGIKDKRINPLKKLPVRQNRKPRDSDPEIHQLLDTIFQDVFGWKARSQGLFVQGHYNVGDYGDPYLIFPIGVFEYVWAWNVGDLWEDYTDYMYTQHDFDQGTIIRRLEQNPNDDEIYHHTYDFIQFEYQNNKLCKALEHRAINEIMIRCKYYYAVYEKWLEKTVDNIDPAGELMKMVYK